VPEARTALLALGTALALGAPAAGPSGSSGHMPAHDAGPAASRSRNLLHNGDSLSVGTQLYLRQALPGWRIRASVDISRHASEGPGILRRYGRRLPRVIVMSLGTNDDPRAVGVFRAAIRRTMRIAGRRRCVVWANIVRPPVAGAGYGALNAALAHEARRRRNLHVFQWARMARANRHWFGPDRVHPSGVGYRARARVIAEVVRRCR
jgi:lysophospholipase L1-like esterase